MTDIFLSYKREDLARVTPLVSSLTTANLSVWWDREVRGGQAWRQEIARELDAARCVIVVWSNYLVGEPHLSDVLLKEFPSPSTASNDKSRYD